VRLATALDADVRVTAGYDLGSVRFECARRRPTMVQDAPFMGLIFSRRAGSRG
jgi:hypothetical protein